MSYFNDINFLYALEAAGVDNWEFYDHVIGDLTDEQRSDDAYVLNELEIGGVDNWSGFDFAIDYYEENFAEPSEDDDVADTPPVEVENVEPERELYPSELRLQRILGDRYEEESKDFWKMNQHPTAFEKARAALKKGGNLEAARMVYLDAIFGKNVGI